MERDKCWREALLQYRRGLRDTCETPLRPPHRLPQHSVRLDPVHCWVAFIHNSVKLLTLLVHQTHDIFFTHWSISWSTRASLTIGAIKLK